MILLSLVSVVTPALPWQFSFTTAAASSSHPDRLRPASYKGFVSPFRGQQLGIKLLCTFNFPPTDLRLHCGTRSSRGENLFTERA
jgi:hypothetical protein